MPLDARKLAHIRTAQRMTFEGRAQPVTLTLRTPTGATEQRTVPAIWRPVMDTDRTLEGPTNATSRAGVEPDVMAIFDQADVSYAQLRATLYVTVPPNPAGTPTVPSGFPAGAHFVLTDLEIAGMPPGGDRYFTLWTRQR